MKSLFALPILAILAIAGDRASAQATVTENQSTYIYVDGRLGSDANSGAQSSPFKTVKAVAAWQSTVQTDYSSVWQLPAASPVTACSAPAPTYTDFTVNLDSNNYTMAAGKAVATIRVNSFGYGPVSLKAEGMPAAVSVSFTRATLTSGVVTLTFSANSAAVAQTVPITLFGTSGSRVHSATFYLNISPL
jgi:hypothetical protein